jgi:hypothetical protein
MGMFDETSLPAAYFPSASSAAHAASTGLFSLRPVHMGGHFVASPGGCAFAANAATRTIAMSHIDRFPAEVIIVVVGQCHHMLVTSRSLRNNMFEA